MNLWKSLHRFALALVVGLLVVPGQDDSAAQEGQPQKQEKKEPTPLAQFLTVGSRIDHVVLARVNNVGLELQSRAVKEKRRAFLVLEITPGQSTFGQVQDLAKVLTSTALSNVTTVAWIPQKVTGNNVLLALACKEIIMHPDAALGDIGRGKALDKGEQQVVISLVEKRYNRKLNAALVRGMMDPQQIVMKVGVIQGPPGNETTESRVVTMQELKRLRENRVPFKSPETIWEAGDDRTLSGSKARALDVLIVQTAESRREIVELYNLPLESQREDPAAGEAPTARLIKIDDVIEPVLETFVERQIQRSVDAGANLLIFEIDSPGGYLLSSKNLAYAIADLDPKQVRTVAYIPKEALSGAAIIALGCDEIYMHPRAVIGDAGPIEIKEGEQFARAPEKVLSLLRETLRDLAERKNRPPGLAMAMADKDLVVFQVEHQQTGRVGFKTDEEIHNSNGEWTKGRPVPESKVNSLLTLSGQRAHELKLAQPPVQGFEELKRRLGIAHEVKVVAATWIDTLVFILNRPEVMFLLIVVGIICIYIELHVVSGLLGILSALCFALFFWSRFLGGTAGWLEVVLFVLGLVCLGLEIFVIPGFGVFGVSGGLLVFAALVMASQTFGNLEPNRDITLMSQTVGTLAASVVSVVVLAMVMSRYLPHMPVLNQIVLIPPGTRPGHDPEEPQLRPEYSGPASPTALLERDHALMGQQGVAMSVLRPAGKVQIDDQYLDVVSDGPYIPQGSTIEVVEVSGNRIVVRQV